MIANHSSLRYQIWLKKCFGCPGREGRRRVIGHFLFVVLKTFCFPLAGAFRLLLLYLSTDQVCDRHVGWAQRSTRDRGFDS